MSRRLISIGFLASGFAILCHPSPTDAQDALRPELQAPFESIIQEMRFEQPTRILARLLTMDAYEDAIWVEWMSRHDGVNWVPVPGRRQFKLLPRHSGMMDYFRTLKPGTTLRMTVQTDREGQRRVLELDDST